MTTPDPDRPVDGAADADLLEQHLLADAAADDAPAVPALDLDVEADAADLQEQALPAPLDEDMESWR